MMITMMVTAVMIDGDGGLYGRGRSTAESACGNTAT